MNDLISDIERRNAEQKKMEEIKLQKICKVKEKNERLQDIMMNNEVKQIEDLQ